MARVVAAGSGSKIAIPTRRQPGQFHLRSRQPLASAFSQVVMPLTGSSALGVLGRAAGSAGSPDAPVQSPSHLYLVPQVAPASGQEIARLKGLKVRPDIKPRDMDNAAKPASPLTRERCPGRGKVRPCVDVEDRIIKAAEPAGSRFKGYAPYQVQELGLTVHAIRYLCERWVTPDRQTIVVPPPARIEGHFGPDLRRFVLQYHQEPSALPHLAALPVSSTTPHTAMSRSS